MKDEQMDKTWEVELKPWHMLHRFTDPGCFKYQALAGLRFDFSAGTVEATNAAVMMAAHMPEIVQHHNSVGRRYVILDAEAFQLAARFASELPPVGHDDDEDWHTPKTWAERRKPAFFLRCEPGGFVVSVRRAGSEMFRVPCKELASEGFPDLAYPRRKAESVSRSVRVRLNPELLRDLCDQAEGSGAMLRFDFPISSDGRREIRVAISNASSLVGTEQVLASGIVMPLAEPGDGSGGDPMVINWGPLPPSSQREM